MRSGTPTSAVRFYNFAPPSARVREKILRGLRRSEKELPSFLLYDARGIRLFDRLSRIGAHSAARRECRLLRRCGPELRRLVGKRSAIVEYGSGTCQTAVALLRTLPGVTAYMPVDLSLSSLKFGVRRLRGAFATFDVIPVRADFTSCFPMPSVGLRPGRTLVYISSCAFSTMDRAAATHLLEGAARFCGQRGGVLLGVDLRTMAPAAHGSRLLEAFNLNALAHVNRQYAANFHPERFRHAVVYDEALQRTELRLASQFDQIVKIDQEKVRLRRGESVLTESWQRYGWHEVERLTRDAGTTIERAWFDDDQAVALVLLRPSL